jgi:hypothetical protein
MPETQEAVDTTQSDNDAVETDEQTKAVTEETITDENQTGETEDVLKMSDDQSEEQEGAPDNYSEFTVPGGFQYKKGRKESFIERAKALNLSQPEAQAALNYEIAILNDLNKKTDEWAKESKSDPVIMEGLPIAKQVIATAPEELQNIFQDMGMFKNPKFLRWAINIGKGNSTQEQPLINGGKKTAPEKVGLDRII